MKQNDEKLIEKKASEARRNVLRMIRANGSGHLGPSFSCIDIVTTLYYHTMNVDPENPKMKDRDIFLLSAGHKGMAQYAVLGEMGFFDKSVYDTYGKYKSPIPGHPDMRKLPGIEINSGSLGHGLNIACGMAMSLKMDRKKSRVFVILGDGELAEGSNWEGAAIAAHYGLDNLVAIVDRNTLQISGRTFDVMSFEPIADHFSGFGWATRQMDGHNIGEIMKTMDALPFQAKKPSLIVANTTKGKGFSNAEDVASYHYWKGKTEELDQADREIDELLKGVE